MGRLSDFLSIDNLKDEGRRLRGKTGYIVSTSISEKLDPSFLNAFTDSFQYLGMHYGGSVHADCSKGFDAQVCEQDIAWFIAQLQTLNTAK